MTEETKSAGIFVVDQKPLRLLDLSRTLFTAKPFKKNGKESGEPKFGAGFLWEKDHPQLLAAKKHAYATARAKWPSRAQAELEEMVKAIFSNGDKEADTAKANKKDLEALRGYVVTRARSKFAPEVTDATKGFAKVMDEKDVYSGCFVIAEFNFVAYEGVGKNPDGVTMYLNKVAKVANGDKIGGGRSAAETFRGYAGKVSTENPVDDSEPSFMDE